MKDNIDILNIFQEKKLVKICAPMVRYSKLQFRNLVKEYGCDICYTPMILADSFCKSSKARINEFTTNLYDAPLVTQFAANTVHDFVGATTLVAPYCNGVDLNCGCPQRWAKQMGLGCIMLEKPQLISDIILNCRNQIPKPFTISVKMRILKDIKQTVEICRQLEHAGVSYLSIHARNVTQLTGEINENCIKLVTENVSCPVVANGGLKTIEDCFNIQNKTSCKGVMVANGLLTNPTMFMGTKTTTLECVQKWLNICYNSTLNTETYGQKSLLIPERPPNLTFQCFHHHLVFMLEKVLPRKKRQIFNNLQTFESVLNFIYQEFNMQPQLFNDVLFNKFQLLKLNYESRDDIYYKLKSEFCVIDDTTDVYDYTCNEGNFFKNKIQKNTGIENDVYNLNDMFIEND